MKAQSLWHDDVIKWKHSPRHWPFVRRIHRSPVNSPHKGQWRGALMFPLICVWINDWVNNSEAGDLRRYQAHYDVIVMIISTSPGVCKWNRTSSWYHPCSECDTRWCQACDTRHQTRDGVTQVPLSVALYIREIKKMCLLNSLTQVLIWRWCHS